MYIELTPSTTQPQKDCLLSLFGCMTMYDMLCKSGDDFGYNLLDRSFVLPSPGHRHRIL